MKINPKSALKILVSLALLTFLLLNGGIDRTFKELTSANLWFLPLGVVVYLLSQMISAYRWQFLARALKFDLSLREFYDYYLMGMFFSLFLPGAIGGDVGRMIYLANRCNRKKREALLTLLAERGVGLVAILILTGIVCLLPVSQVIPIQLRGIVWGLSLAGLAGFLFLRLGPLDALVNRFPKLEILAQARLYWQDDALLVRSILISMVVHASMVGVHWMIAQAFGLSIPVLYLIATYGIVSLASVIPISFNGIGVREGAYVRMLLYAGVPQHTGFAFGLYWFSISLLTSLVGGLIFMKGHYKTPELQQSEVV